MTRAKKNKAIKGCFPTITLDEKEVLRHVKLRRLLTSVSFIPQQQKRDVHDVLSFNNTIFLDCGIFQKYKEELSWNFIKRYRKILVQRYKFLSPDIASVLDIPSLLWFSVREKQRRLKWTLDNFEFMSEQLPDLPLVLGVSVFSRKSSKIISQKIFTKYQPKYLALGGLVPLLSLSIRKPELGKVALRAIYHFSRSISAYSANLHVYGAGGPRYYMLVRLLGADSADYAGWIKLSSVGRVLIPRSGSRYILNKVKRKGKTVKRPPEMIVSSEERKILNECSCPVCKHNDPLILERSKLSRLTHNLYVLVRESQIVDEFCAENDYEGLHEHIRKQIKPDSSMRGIADYAIRLLKKK